MFEKEAEDSFIGKKVLYKWETDKRSYIDGFKAGAEFGYNKAKVEVEGSYRESICNSELNLASVTEQLEELEKANEWHFVKDELPPLNTNVLVIHKWHRTPEVGKRITVFPNCSKWVWAMCCDRYRYTSDDQNVIAWKEIVLPKENE